jgi:SPP1 gp7 family putative phage head morphogenesis protein
LADPSRTAGIKRQYRADLNRRWNRINALIWETVVVNDALRLSPPLARAAARAANPFQFRTDPEGKVDDFLTWLNESMDDEVLEIARGPAGRITRNSRWQSAYVRASYGRGLEHAQRSMRRQGIRVPQESVADLFNAPTSVASLARLYARSFNELRGITGGVSQTIGRVLTEGLATGQGPRAIAGSMRTAVSSLGMARSLTMARTEIINAHADATLDRYGDVGVRDVVGQAEFLTAQDDRVCPDCIQLEGQTYNIDEARGIIPVHPNCRCVWLPVIL